MSSPIRPVQGPPAAAEGRPNPISTVHNASERGAYTDASPFAAQLAALQRSADGTTQPATPQPASEDTAQSVAPQPASEDTAQSVAPQPVPDGGAQVSVLQRVPDAPHGSPPPELLDQVAAAGRIWQRLSESGQQVRFSTGQGGAVAVELQDREGRILREMSAGQAIDLATAGAGS